jgi:hypothetical protein
MVHGHFNCGISRNITLRRLSPHYFFPFDAFSASVAITLPSVSKLDSIVSQ